MSVNNTEKLTQLTCDLGNSGLRAFMLPTGEQKDLAKYFGLGVRTVQRWFAGQGQQYRRCVTSYAWQTTPDGDTTPGMRVIDMFDAQNPTGIGDGTPYAMGGSDMNNLRQRCFLAFCLGVYGGLVRIPIYNGNPKTITEPKGTLHECVYRINQIYCGGASYFLSQAWVAFEIEPDENTGEGWLLNITYNNRAAGDASDAEEEEVDEEGE